MPIWTLNLSVGFVMTIYRPEDYGAVGNGSTNDTDAMAAMSAAITAADGGIVEFAPGVTYIVGKQTLANDGFWMYKPSEIVTISSCSRAVILRGNGAKLKFANALKFGTFNSAGAATTHAQPYYTLGELSAPAPVGMIAITACTAPVTIENLELDGNVANLSIGGPYGDTGHQLPGDGIYLANNVGGQRLSNIRSHHMPRDGLQIGDTVTASTSRSNSLFENLILESNVRQGWSLVGGRGYTLVNCKFNNTGKGTPIFSGPGAGVDLEQETGLIRDIIFIGCEFANNGGASFLAVGDVADILCLGCTFVGTTTWAIYGAPRRCKIADSTIVGSFVNPHGSANRTDAAQFLRCEITDDPALSPTGVVFLASGWIPDFGGGAQNVLFDQCDFRMVATGRGPYSYDCIYRDCRISVTGTPTHVAFPFGVHEGRNIVDAGLPAQLAFNVGRTIVQGTVLLEGSKTYDPPSIAAGASVSTTLTMPGIVLGDLVEASFTLDLQGVIVDAYVSAVDTATIYLTNRTASTVDLGSGTLFARAKTRLLP